jgi:hypothetical protein
MRLVKISLGRDIPFWFLGAIKLNTERKETEFFDIDSLSDEEKKVVNISAKQYVVRLWDTLGQRIPSIDETVLTKADYPIDTDDINDEEISIPEIATITVSEKTELPKVEVPSEEDIKDAKILIKRNGNTIKKIVQAMEQNSKNLMVLTVAEELELEGKNRQGLLDCFKETKTRWQNGRSN